MENRFSCPWLVAALVLASCAGTKPTTPATGAAATSAAAPVAGPPGVGLDVADLDRPVNPCEDFFRFSSGNWLRNNPVPSYASS